MLLDNIKTWTGSESDILELQKKTDYYENSVRIAFFDYQKQLLVDAQNGDFESFVDVVENCRQSDLISFEYKQYDNVLTVTAITIRFENEQICFRIHGNYTEKELCINKNEFIRLIKVEKI